jgi:hypothetical protein
MKKTLLFLAIMLVLSISIYGQATNDYGTVAAGDWNTLSIWKKWDGSGFNTTATVIPTKTDNVWIQGGYTVTVSGATCLCNNLHITGNSTLSCTGGGIGSPVYPVIFGSSVDVASGSKFGTSAADFVGISLSSGAATTLTITGAGSINIYRYRVNTAGSFGLTIGDGTNPTTVGFNYSASATSSGASLFFDGGSSKFLGNFTVKANSTVNFGAYSNMSAGSSSLTAYTGTPEVDVYGTINCGTAATLSLLSTGISTIHIFSGGILNVPKNFTPSSTTAPTALPAVITVDNGGTLSVGSAGTGTCDFSLATQTVTGAGTFNLLSGSTLTIGAATGLEPVAGPIRTTIRNFNSGAGYTYIGSVAQVLGSDLPSTISNLTFSNTSGITASKAVTVSSTLTLGGNNSYTNLSNISGYTGLTYAATVAQTTGTELGSSITTLTINNAAGVTLGSPTTVNGNFYLTSGLLTTSAAHLLTLGAVDTVKGGSATSFVNGPVAVTGRSTIPMVAPVGKGSAYRPLTSVLTINSGSGVFTVEQFETAPTGTITPSNVSAISAKRYFHISQTGNIVGTATIQLTWGSDDGVNTPSRMTVVGGTNGGQWIAENNSGGFTGTSASGSITTNAQSSNAASGDFVLGSYDSNPLPVNLSSFSAVPSNGKINLSWKTSVETNNHGFDVERSADKSVWASLTFIQGQGNSNTAKEYSYSDNSITKAGTYYYRLKQIDNNGGYKYSDITEADYVVPTAYSLNQNYPNPFNPNTMISYSLPLASNVKISVYNAIGETVKILENGFKSAGNYSVSFNAANMPSGIYFYRIEAGTFSQVRKMMLLK